MEALQNLAKTMDTMPMAPLFVLAHMFLVALSLRVMAGAPEFATKHPFPSWFVCVTSCFSGKVIQNFLLGKPMIEIYLNGWNVALATFVWYIVFFAPVDCAACFLNNKYSKAALKVLKELHRTRAIKDGILVAGTAYSGNIMAGLLIGTIRGSGAAWLLRPLYQFVLGNIKPENEFYKPGFASKYAFMSAATFLLCNNGYLNIHPSTLVLILFILGSIGQVSMLFNVIGDPYARLENLACYLTIQLPNEIMKKSKSKDD